MKSHKITKAIISASLRFFFRSKAIGLENIPPDGKYIVCSNHKSNCDPVILGGLLPHYMRYLAKSELFKFKPLAWLVTELGAVPINRTGANAGAIKTAQALVNQGDVLVVFPQGHRRKVFDVHEGKSGAALIAQHTNVPIVPVGIRGFSINVGKPIEVGNDIKASTLQIMNAIEELI